MLKFEQFLLLNNIDTETTLAFAYQAMQNLQWNILSVETATLTGSTLKTRESNSQKIVCRIDGGKLIIRSEMSGIEMADNARKNRKNTEEFVHAFENVKASANIYSIEYYKNALTAFRDFTGKVYRQQQEQTKFKQVPDLIKGSLYATYTIIAVNVLVFVLMVLDGAGIFEANGLVHIKWGSNFTPYTLSGDWWRLLTSIFIHFGIIHLTMNMYCLYIAGVYLEAMLGRPRYITAYLCTGILSSVVSLWWHKAGINSAGASGAIFGMYGVFLALLTSSLISKEVRPGLLTSICIFIAYNLVFGMKSGIDNSAHVGGLLSGFIVGYLYIYDIGKERKYEHKTQWLIPAIILATGFIAFGYLQKNKVPAAERNTILSELTAFLYSDNEKFISSLTQFGVINETVTSITNDNTLTNGQLINKIDSICSPQLQQAFQIINNTTKYDIPASSHAKASKILQYIGLRKIELDVLKQMAETTKTDRLMVQLNEIRTKAYALFNEITNE